MLGSSFAMAATANAMTATDCIMDLYRASSNRASSERAKSSKEIGDSCACASWPNSFQLPAFINCHDLWKKKAVRVSFPAFVTMLQLRGKRSAWQRPNFGLKAPSMALESMALKGSRNQQSVANDYLPKSQTSAQGSPKDNGLPGSHVQRLSKLPKDLVSFFLPSLSRPPAILLRTRPGLCLA